MKFDGGIYYIDKVSESSESIIYRIHIQNN